MIGGTTRFAAPSQKCGRCGMDLDDRWEAVNCKSCVSVLRIGSSRRASNRGRAIARAEGWDFDEPHLGPWGREP